jgi:hypothetical protein
MGSTRVAYPAEFRRQMVDLVHAGCAPEELAPRARADGTIDQELGRTICTRYRSRRWRPVECGARRAQSAAARESPAQA